MEVSKNAWHYKILMQETQSKISNGTSLCRYFWMVVFAMFAWTIIGIMGIIGFSAIAIVIYGFFYVWYFMIAGGFGVETFDVDWVEWSLVINAIILAVWVLTVIQRIIQKVKNTELPKTDNLAFEYLKAKKQKICPIIEFRD